MSKFIAQEKRQRPATLLKKRLWHRCFPVFSKFLRTPFLKEFLRRQLLQIYWRNLYGEIYWNYREIFLPLTLNWNIHMKFVLTEGFNYLPETLSTDILELQTLALHKKWSFPLRISPVNFTKLSVSCGFGHINWRNPQWKTSFFVQCCKLGKFIFN